MTVQLSTLSCRATAVNQFRPPLLTAAVKYAVFLAYSPYEGRQMTFVQKFLKVNLVISRNIQYLIHHIHGHAQRTPKDTILMLA